MLLYLPPYWEVITGPTQALDREGKRLCSLYRVVISSGLVMTYCEELRISRQPVRALFLTESIVILMAECFHWVNLKIRFMVQPGCFEGSQSTCAHCKTFWQRCLCNFSRMSISPLQLWETERVYSDTHTVHGLNQVYSFVISSIHTVH